VKPLVWSSSINCLERFFLLRRALQLKEHVLHWEIFATARDRSQAWLRMRIARERDTIHFIDALRDPRASMQT